MMLWVLHSLFTGVASTYCYDVWLGLVVEAPFPAVKICLELTRFFGGR
ncbi:unnamed protein product [Musa acuminata subsp. burmannicoides]